MNCSLKSDKLYLYIYIRLDHQEPAEANRQAEAGHQPSVQELRTAGTQLIKHPHQHHHPHLPLRQATHQGADKRLKQQGAGHLPL